MGGVLSFPYTYWKDTRSFSTMDHRHHGPQNYQHDIEAPWCMLSEAEAARFYVITQRTFHEYREAAAQPRWLLYDDNIFNLKWLLGKDESLYHQAT